MPWSVIVSDLKSACATSEQSADREMYMNARFPKEHNCQSFVEKRSVRKSGPFSGHLYAQGLTAYVLQHKSNMKRLKR